MSITVKHTPQEYCENVYIISGDKIEELVTECLLKIRPHSKEYYQKELTEDLQTKGESLIDSHAGCGTFYQVIWTNFVNKNRLRDENV